MFNINDFSHHYEYLMNHKINVNTYHIFHTARFYPQFIKYTFILFKGRVTFFDHLLCSFGNGIKLALDLLGQITASDINYTCYMCM